MRRAPAIPALVVAMTLFGLAAPGRSGADIIRWVDDEGTPHFTDDPGSIPKAHRNDAVTVIRQPAGATGAPPEAPEAPPAAAEPEPEPDPGVPAAAPVSEARRLRAKIEAKESFVREIDRKRSQAVGAQRGRAVSPADADLYDKYRAELPADRERLRRLESPD